MDKDKERRLCKDFTHQSLFSVFGKYYCISDISCVKPFVAPVELSVYSDELPQVMSLGSEDYKFENEKDSGVWS